MPGRLYKIDVNYRPIKVEESAGKTTKIDTKPYLRIMEEIDNKVKAQKQKRVYLIFFEMYSIVSIN